MDKLKPHPLEDEIDKVLQTLEIDIATAKQNFDTGVMYNFIFEDTYCYIALPTYISNRPRNVVRFEFTFGEVIKKDVSQILFAVALDMDFKSHQIFRLIPRTKDSHQYQIILQGIYDVDLIQNGFVTNSILNGIELASAYRFEFLISKKALPNISKF